MERNGSIRLKLLLKYFGAINDLVLNIATFRGHVSAKHARQSFELYWLGFERGSHVALVGYPSFIESSVQKSLKGDIIKDPRELAFNDLTETVESVTKDEGNGMIEKMFPKKENYTEILRNVKKLCPPRGVIFEMNIDRPAKQVKILKLQNNERKRVDDWIANLEEATLTEIIGYFVGFRETKSMFWILLEDGEQEIKCLLDEHLFHKLVGDLKPYTKISVKGKFEKSPGSPPRVIEIANIKDLDREDEELTKDLDPMDDLDDEMLARLEPPPSKQGKGLSHEQMLEIVASWEED